MFLPIYQYKISLKTFAKSNYSEKKVKKNTVYLKIEKRVSVLCLIVSIARQSSETPFFVFIAVDPCGYNKTSSNQTEEQNYSLIRSTKAVYLLTISLIIIIEKFEAPKVVVGGCAKTVKFKARECDYAIIYRQFIVELLLILVCS